MTDYVHRFEAAEIDARLQEAVSKVHQLRDDQIADVDVNDDFANEGLVDRVKVLLDHALVLVASADQRLVPWALVNDLLLAVAEISAALDGVLGLEPAEISMATIRALSQGAESLAAQLTRWPRTEDDDWRTSVTSAAATFRRSVAQQLREVKVQFDQDQGQIQRVLATSKEQLETAEVQLDEIESRIEAASATLARTVDQINAALATFQQQFSDAQERRTQEAADTRDKLIEDTNTLLAAQERVAQERLDAITALVDKSEYLVNVFAAAGTGNAYRTEAREQKDAADAWRLGAIGLGLVAGIAAATVLLGIASGDRGWQLLIGKLAVSLTFGGLAAYAARQSGHHRSREHEARHLELNLATFGSLTDELDPDDLEKARAALVMAMLQRDASRDAASLDVIGDSQINLLTRLADALSKLR